MVRSTRILHDNVEYLVQDYRGSQAGRNISILARPEVGTDPGSGSLGLIRTNHGDWIPIARWEEGRITLQEKVPDKVRPALEGVLDQYLKHQNRKVVKGKRKRYFYIENEGGVPDFTLAPSHPYGLAVRIFSRKALVRPTQAEDGFGASASRTRQTDDLRRFLVNLADAGFAGAVLDENAPIYFCLDEHEEMIFLRLNLNKDEKMDEFLLREDGSWEPYEGDEDIEFYLDQDRCDGNMVKNLGDIPFLGHEEMECAWTVEEKRKPGLPFVLAAEDGLFQNFPGGKAALLFKERESALDFILDLGLLKCEAVLVDDLKSFLHQAQQKSLIVLLEPTHHRAASATLWLNGKEVILDSFSGFWVKGKDWTFDHT